MMLDYLDKYLPIRLVLPDSNAMPTFYQRADPGNILQLCDTVFIWLEDSLGQGAESQRPPENLIRISNWWIEEVEQEYSNMTGGFCRQFAIRFKNKDDAALFKLTWL